MWIRGDIKERYGGGCVLSRCTIIFFIIFFLIFLFKFSSEKKEMFEELADYDSLFERLFITETKAPMRKNLWLDACMYQACSVLMLVDGHIYNLMMKFHCI